MPDTLREDLRKLIAEQQVLVVVGSGVSIAATNNAPAASWDGLLRLGVARCGELYPHEFDAERRDWLLAGLKSKNLRAVLSVAEQVAEQLGGNSGPEFQNWIAETVGGLRTHNRALLEAVRDLEVPLATTNYDSLLTEVTGRPPVTWMEQREVANVLRSPHAGILHLHGHWKNPASIVLGIRSYEQVKQDAHAAAVIRALAMTKSLLFIGCGDGLSDPNFRPFLSWLGAVSAQNKDRHYRLARAGEVAELQREHPAEQRIFVLQYGADYPDLAPFLASLAPGASGVPPTITAAPSGKKTTGKKTLPPSPPLSPAIVAYVRRLREATAKLQLVGIGKGVQIELPIEQAYIPLNVLAQRQLHAGQPEHFDKLSLEAEGRSDAPVELSAIFQHALAHGHRGVILLGDPGAGKTTGARQFCWRVLTAPDVPAALGLPRDVVPVFLRLRDLRREHTTLNDFICAAVAAPALPADKANPGPDLLAREGVLWVFDGLDEVVDEAARIRVCQWIDAAREQRTGDCFLVTSRYQGYQGKVNLGAAFCQFQVRPLTTEQVREFVAHWYRAVFRRLQKDETDAAVEIASLLKLLDEPAYRIGRLRELPANPLMLTILCVVHHENHNLPRRRADLYARCVRVLVEHWRQPVREAAGLLPFDPEAAESVLGSVAWWLHGAENRTTETVAALGAEATKALGDIAASAGLGRDGQVFIERMRDESGILAPFGDGQTGFLHLTFQEYLAGAHAARKMRAGELAAAFGKSWWREATLMAVALGEPPFVQEFFTAVLQTGALGAQRELVEQCLEEARHVTLEPFLAALQAPGVKAVRQVELLRLLTRQSQPALLAVCEELARGRDREVVALAREILQRAGGAAQPRAVVGGEGFVDARTGMAFVWIPAGEFDMGQAKSDRENERPVHRVTISQGFWLAKYPVTNAEYQKYLEANPQAQKPSEWNNSRFNEPQQPVVGVSWHDVQAFCAWAGYRLPTEAEWEYACRAGTKTQFSFGDDEALLKDYGWYDANSGGKTHAVGQKKPNPWGLYDMHGNVWEWCQDSMRTYEAKAVIDPMGPTDGRDRVLRGGSWISVGRYARSAIRGGYAPDDGYSRIGFRPCPSSISPAGEAGGRKSPAERA